ncbi:uncharacterized protein BXZ73DRAFT_37206 [Epithele typhae]|uniref:uncharacterized protein n=1 Tax=Epithele typhae TaxID=378194 RepID=UPI0020088534|nr:uncharacterized protein BXZ73DRAFT_37206 [Epithele typhae]KAH9945949.1 hypothetical protein BXZ73DRAFT_37206 [Epithele typhae]
MSTLSRTYSTRSAKAAIPSSPISEIMSSPPAPQKRKRPFTDLPTEHNTPTKRPRRMSSSSSLPSSSAPSTLKPKGKPKLPAGTKAKSSAAKKAAPAPKQARLTQLHFALDAPTLRTCPLCDLSYTRGAPDDEALHRAHCARVRRGLEWGREEQREADAARVEELLAGVKLANGARGRVVCFRPDVGGKIGAKLAVLLETIRLALTSPALSPAVLRRSKIYLFLLTAPGPSPAREKIVGCVVAQRIATAMAIARSSEVSAARSKNASASTTSTPASSQTVADALSSQGTIAGEDPSESAPSLALLPVDDSTNLYVHPTPLPTPMGIPRLFVSSEYRRLGIASRLLSVAASTFILGCPLNPARGEVAFTQPTGAGKGVLEAWGKGGVRIYEEEGDA